MSEPTDKQLHEWVRRTLDPYRPDYHPEDWERLKEIRNRGRRRKPILPLLAGLISLLGIGLWYATPAEKELLTTKSPAGRRYVKPRENVAVHPGRLKEKATFNRKADAKPSRLSRHIHPRGKDTFWETRSIPRRYRAVIRQNVALKLPALPTPDVRYSPEDAAIRHALQHGVVGPDSTTYRVMNRNIRRWPGAVLVCDMTTSMYPYSTQLVAWLRANADSRATQGMVFFTDCDSLGRETRPGGLPGQMFVTREREAVRVLPVLLAAARNTINNRENGENGVEALLYAQRRFPEAEHLVLVVDNKSAVKDLALLGGVTKPVHVILCGTTWDSTQAFSPDYYEIARRTRGSLHTLEDDLDPRTVSGDTWLKVGPRYYRYAARRERFVLSRFRHRPRRFLGLFWL